MRFAVLSLLFLAVLGPCMGVQHHDADTTESYHRRQEVPAGVLEVIQFIQTLII